MSPRGLLPPLFGLPWERADAPVQAEARPDPQPEQKTPSPATPPPDDYGLVLQPRRRNPTWLDPYKKRLAEANKVAAERTKHLKGADRVRAMNQIVRELMRAGHGPAA